MFYTFRSMVIEAWDAWGGLFNGLPYGDPYIAGFTLGLIVAITCKMVADGHI